MSTKENENEFSDSEKLALIAQGVMDPKELGMADAEEARLQIMPEAAKKPQFGTALMFRAGVVPIELRAEWAASEAKILPFDKEAYIAEHKNEYPIQGELLCGNLQAKFSRAFSDPVLGLAQMLRITADMLEAKYTEGDEKPEAPVEQTPPKGD